MVRIELSSVHPYVRARARRAQDMTGSGQSTEMRCAQTAIIATNRASEANVVASSITARNTAISRMNDNKPILFLFCSKVKQMIAGARPVLFVKDCHHDTTCRHRRDDRRCASTVYFNSVK